MHPTMACGATLREIRFTPTPGSPRAATAQDFPGHARTSHTAAPRFHNQTCAESGS